ncbi:MAG: MFS transporter, partial [Pseudobdellovibrionaceae bacterium]
MKLNSFKFLCGIGYGLGELGMMAIEVFMRVHLFVFLQSTLKFDPFWVGFAMALGVVWDALMDPWIGVWSDRYKIWKGERFSFIFVGLLLSLLSFILLFHLSIDPNSILGILILCLLSIFLNSSLTVMSVPYLSLVGEIALSKKERSFLIASRLGLANFGSILGIAIPGYYLAKGMEPYNPSSWLLCGLLVFTVCISVLSAMLLKKMNKDSLQNVSRSSHFSQQNSVVQLFKQIIQDKRFLVILGAYFVANVAMSLNSSLALYYYRERLQLSENEVRNVLLIFLVFFTFSIPLWVWLGQKFSIIRSLNWGVFLLGVSSFLIYPLLPAGEAWAVYFFASFI